MDQLPHILPDYMLVFAVPVLTHDPTFTAVDDSVQLKQIEKCLWLVLEPLITNKEFFCYGFYKNLCERMKNHKDALKPDDEFTNQVCLSDRLFIHDSNFNAFFFVLLQKLWAICDIAIHLIFSKTSNYDTRDFSLNARIPVMFYQAVEGFQNTRVYIPPDMYSTYNSGTTSAKKTGIVIPVSSKSTI